MRWPMVGRDAALDHATAQLGSGTGIAILGPAGVGKSRLLHELSDAAERSGAAVVRVVASATTSSIPFAPFVELLPGGPTPDRLAMLGAARMALDARRRTGGLVVAIDDAHHLDEASLAFVIAVVGSGLATVAMTARTGETMPPDLVDLWTNGVIERIDVGPLTRDDAADLIGRALGDVTPELEAELWRLSEGNPLLLHELIEGAVGRSIVRADGTETWGLTGSIAASPRLADLVRSRLDALPDDVRPAMDVVAVGAPLPWDLARVATGEHLGALEALGLVDAIGADGDRSLVPAHPLYGEILKAHLGDTRRQAAHRALADAASRVDQVSDPLRAALWQHEGGGPTDPELALAGAHEALVRHDPKLAEALLRPLDARQPPVGLLLGRALSYTQQFAEAEELLAELEGPDDTMTVEIASIRAQNLAFGLGRVSDAADLLARVADEIAVPDLRARLINEQAMVSAIHGDLETSRSASESVLADAGTSEVSRAAAYVTLTIALAMTCDADRIDELLDDALDLTDRVRDALPFANDQIRVMQAASAVNAGRLGEALAVCETAIVCADRGSAMLTTWLSTSVLVHEMAGRLDDALSATAIALPLFAEVDPFGLEGQLRGLIAIAHGQRGRSTPTAFIEQVPGTGARVNLWCHRGKAWSAAADGDLAAAVDSALTGARVALDDEHTAWAAFSLCDAVRFGAAQRVLGAFADIDTSRGAHLIAAMHEHARACAAGDADALDQVAGRYSAMHASLLAADAYAQAATMFERTERPIDAARAALRSAAWELRSQDPLTPALLARPATVSARELEVARDAAEGLTSPEIAERRFISVRTVDNHLRSVYRKLSISGREELAELLRLP